MFEIKDENGNEVDFKSLTKKQQDKIFEEIANYMYRAETPKLFEFTRDNFERIIEEIKSCKYK